MFLVPQTIRAPPTVHVTTSTNETLLITSPLLNNSFDSGVPTWALILITLSPFLFAIITSCIRPQRNWVRAWLHCYMCTQGMENVIVEFIKRYVGYWRPHAMFSCGYQLGECLDAEGDLFQSFPSGHSSDSMAAMLNVTLMLLAFFQVATKSYRYMLGEQHTVDFRSFVITLCCAPTIFGLWVCASRVHDMDHHPADVIAGAIIGGASALFWYFAYFNSPFSNSPGPMVIRGE